MFYVSGCCLNDGWQVTKNGTSIAVSLLATVVQFIGGCAGVIVWWNVCERVVAAMIRRGPSDLGPTFAHMLQVMQILVPSATLFVFKKCFVLDPIQGECQRRHMLLRNGLANKVIHV